MARSRTRGGWLEAVGLVGLGVVVGFLLGAVPATGEVLDFEGFAGGDFDLRTPGPGSGNTIPQGNVLIIPKNVIDSNQDGLIGTTDGKERKDRDRIRFLRD